MSDDSCCQLGISLHELAVFMHTPCQGVCAKSLRINIKVFILLFVFRCGCSFPLPHQDLAERFAFMRLSCQGEFLDHRTNTALALGLGTGFLCSRPLEYRSSANVVVATAYFQAIAFRSCPMSPRKFNNSARLRH